MIYVAKGAIFVGGQGHVPQGQIRILCDPEVIGSRHTESWVRLVFRVPLILYLPYYLALTYPPKGRDEEDF